MTTRTIEEWHQLFSAHTARHLSEKHSCKQQGLCPKHFTKCKKPLFMSDPRESLPSGFVKVKPALPAIESIGHV